MGAGEQSCTAQSVQGAQQSAEIMARAQGMAGVQSCQPNGGVCELPL
jgi:hypothetical protein